MAEEVDLDFIIEEVTVGEEAETSVDETNDDDADVTEEIVTFEEATEHASTLPEGLNSEENDRGKGSPNADELHDITKAADSYMSSKIKDTAKQDSDDWEEYLKSLRKQLKPDDSDEDEVTEDLNHGVEQSCDEVKETESEKSEPNLHSAKSVDNLGGTGKSSVQSNWPEADVSHRVQSDATGLTGTVDASAEREHAVRLIDANSSVETSSNPEHIISIQPVKELQGGKDSVVWASIDSSHGDGIECQPENTASTLEHLQPKDMVVIDCDSESEDVVMISDDEDTKKEKAKRLDQLKQYVVDSNTRQKPVEPMPFVIKPASNPVKNVSHSRPGILRRKSNPSDAEVATEDADVIVQGIEPAPIVIHDHYPAAPPKWYYASPDNTKLVNRKRQQQQQQVINPIAGNAGLMQQVMNYADGALKTVGGLGVNQQQPVMNFFIFPQSSNAEAVQVPSVQTPAVDGPMVVVPVSTPGATGPPTKKVLLTLPSETLAPDSNPVQVINSSQLFKQRNIHVAGRRPDPTVIEQLRRARLKTVTPTHPSMAQQISSQPVTSDHSNIHVASHPTVSAHSSISDPDPASNEINPSEPIHKSLFHDTPVNIPVRYPQKKRCIEPVITATVPEKMIGSQGALRRLLTDTCLHVNNDDNIFSMKGDSVPVNNNRTVEIGQKSSSNPLEYSSKHSLEKAGNSSSTSSVSRANSTTGTNNVSANVVSAKANDSAKVNSKKVFVVHPIGSDPAKLQSDKLQKVHLPGSDSAKVQFDKLSKVQPVRSGSSKATSDKVYKVHPAGNDVTGKSINDVLASILPVKLSDRERIMCRRCEKLFLCLQSYQDHCSESYCIQPLVCHLCPQMFTNFLVFISHISLMHSSKWKVCDCCRPFTTYMSLFSHSLKCPEAHKKIRTNPHTFSDDGEPVIAPLHWKHINKKNFLVDVIKSKKDGLILWSVSVQFKSVMDMKNILRIAAPKTGYEKIKSQKEEERVITVYKNKAAPVYSFEGEKILQTVSLEVSDKGKQLPKPTAAVPSNSNVNSSVGSSKANTPKPVDTRKVQGVSTPHNVSTSRESALSLKTSLPNDGTVRQQPATQLTPNQAYEELVKGYVADYIQCEALPSNLAIADTVYTLPSNVGPSPLRLVVDGRSNTAKSNGTEATEKTNDANVVEIKDESEDEEIKTEDQHSEEVKREENPNCNEEVKKEDPNCNEEVKKEDPNCNEEIKNEEELHFGAEINKVNQPVEVNKEDQHSGNITVGNSQVKGPKIKTSRIVVPTVYMDDAESSVDPNFLDQMKEVGGLEKGEGLGYVCTYCLTVFKYKLQLMHHIGTVHSVNGCDCYICQRQKVQARLLEKGVKA